MAAPSGVISRGRIDNLVVKVAERCNLNCSYCYIYNHEDTSYLRRPKFMEESVFEDLLLRAREYCDRRPHHRISMTLHGGEPTLLGPQRLSAYARRARQALGDRFGGMNMQTNGTLIDDEWIKVFQECSIPVSVSLDGPAHAHDLNRVDHLGRGSHAAAVRGLLRLQEAGLRPGVLCVINPAADGRENYLYFRSLGVRNLDFLFPDATWESKERLYTGYGPTPVADYLIPLFDEWFAEDDPDIRIRVLWGLLSRMMGGSHCSDAFGNPLSGYLIIETDGSIQALDALRVCEDGLDGSGLNVATHGFDDLEQGLPMVHRLVHEGFPLCAKCQSCPELTVCGGGYLPHRYSRKNGFVNPSIWCADILKLIGHLRKKTGLSENVEPMVAAEYR